MNDTSKPATGLVIRYNYLWTRQADAGEDSGRKARPVCVAIPVGRTGNDVVLFPITTQEPLGHIAIEIPETERRRLKLPGGRRCWLILDEANHDQMPGSYHLEPIGLSPARYAYGVLSHAFMRLVLAKLAEAIRSHKFRTVSRD